MIDQVVLLLIAIVRLIRRLLKDDCHGCSLKIHRVESELSEETAHS